MYVVDKYLDTLIFISLTNLTAALVPDIFQYKNSNWPVFLQNTRLSKSTTDH